MSRRLVTTTKKLIWRKKSELQQFATTTTGRARDKTLKQLSLAILQFVVFTSQFHLIYLTLSSSLLMRFWIHFLFLSVLIIISYSFSSFRGLISSSTAWLPSDWASDWREFTSWPKLGCDKNLSALGLYLFNIFFRPTRITFDCERFFSLVRRGNCLAASALRHDDSLSERPEVAFPCK